LGTDKGSGGGGVFAHDHSSPILTNCVISGNYANGWAGAGLYCQGTSNPALTNCTISQNVARVDGGGAYNAGGINVNTSSQPSLTNCILEGMPYYAIWEDDNVADVFLKYCVFYNNGTADMHNGHTGVDGTGGEAINAFDGCSGNIAGDPNPAFVVGATGRWASVAYDALTNRTTLTANGTPPFTAGALVGKLINADTTQTRQAVILANTASTVTVPNDITVATGTLGYAASTRAFAVMDYQIQSGSPCKDTATPTGAPAIDILGTVRPQGAGYDIGAYERVVPVTVTFDAQSGTTAVPPSKVVTTGLTYGDLATTDRAGYTFAGWWTASTGGTEVLTTTTVTTTADLTLYAHWTVNTYTVTFDAQSGTTPLPTSKLVTYDSAYGALATTGRVGYVFAGWWTASTGGSQVLSTTNVATASDHTLYARWAVAHTVTFD
ncbi:MAG: InlB B-repeat-containing protein, partial [Candidatus Hydrogenedentes bacterium]|nr:InlB B-repeat-containing protein [Candidatus Hydrogenedentota bacterium]